MQVEHSDNLLNFYISSTQEKYDGVEALQVLDQEKAKIVDVMASSGMVIPSGDAGPMLGIFITKAMTRNTATGKVHVYRKEAFLMRVNWGKTLMKLGAAVSAIVGSGTFIGFVAFVAWGYGFIKEAGVELTVAEAIVFTAVYDHRNEHAQIAEDDLDRFCRAVASSLAMEPLAEETGLKALGELQKLGVISLENGFIALQEEWVRKGAWR